ncbi:MAG: lysylphosphatidylglycerol synthase transmembrane domain-containing protein [Candidatus Vecturithrix sp.]|nr:lysylphosphatidylglycerol synthase transmembrane domain-containing protein [Candidatus Vecturithrix sp.]
MRVKFWIGMLISIGCLYFVFRKIDVVKLFETLRSVNYLYLVVAMLLQLSTIWLRAERWKYLLAPIKPLTFRHLVPATMIGFMANNVLPARAGEFIRAYVIGKKEHISKTSSFATIILERICDMITMLGFLLLVVVFVRFPQAPSVGTNTSFLSPDLLKKAGGLSALLVFGILAFLVLLKEFPQKTTAIVRQMLQPLPQSISHNTLKLLESFRTGLQVLRTGRHLVFLVFWSFLIWYVAVLCAWMILHSFALNFSLMAAMLMTVTTSFSVAVPSSPGYIGPFHAAVSAGVLFFVPNMDKSAVAGIALIYHLTSIAPITLAGLYYLWKENMSLSEIQHLDKDAAAQSEFQAHSVDV